MFVVVMIILYETWRELKLLKAAEKQFVDLFKDRKPVSVDDLMNYLGLTSFSWFIILEIAMRTDVDLFKAIEYAYQQINACHEQLFSEGTYWGGFILDEAFYATPMSRTAGELLSRQDYQRRSAQQLLSTIQSVQTAVYNLRADQQKIDERLGVFEDNLRGFNEVSDRRKINISNVEEWPDEVAAACLTGSKEEFVRGIFIDEYGGNASISALATGRATGGKPVETFRGVMMWFYRVQDYKSVDELVKNKKINPAVAAVLKRKLQEYLHWKINYYQMLHRLKTEIHKNMSLQLANLRSYKMWAARHIAAAEKIRIDTFNEFQRTSERGQMEGVVREQIEWVPRVRYTAYFLFTQPMWHFWKPMWKVLVERAMVVYSEPGTPFLWGRVRTWSYIGIVEVERLANVVQWASFNVWWRGDPTVFSQRIPAKRARSHAFLMYWLNKASGFSPWETIDYGDKLFNKKNKPKWLKELEDDEGDLEAEEYGEKEDHGHSHEGGLLDTVFAKWLPGIVNFITFGWLDELFRFDPSHVNDGLVTRQVERVEHIFEPLRRGIAESWYSVIDILATFGLYPKGLGLSYGGDAPPIDRYGRFRGMFGGLFSSRRRRAMYALLFEMQPIFTAAMQEAWRGAFKFDLNPPQMQGRH